MATFKFWNTANGGKWQKDSGTVHAPKGMQGDDEITCVGNTVSFNIGVYNQTVDLDTDTVEIDDVAFAGTAAELQDELNAVFRSAAPVTALPTETAATYADMTASIAADGDTKRDFFVTADETNGGAAASYRYDGSKLINISYGRIGQVATRCFVPSKIYNAYTQFNSRSSHRMRDGVTYLKIAIPNWYISTTSPYEINTGSAATVKASIEYPLGTFTQVLFSGSATGTIASGDTLLSDSVSINIPTGATFWVRIFCTNPSGIIVKDDVQFDSAGGEAYEFANTGSLTDKTMSGTIAVNGTLCFSPVAIISQTKKPSVLLIGDSRVAGASSTVEDGAADVGNIAPSIGAFMGYINTARSSQEASKFLLFNSKRVALAAYCSHVIVAIGINGISSGTSTDLKSIAALFPGKIIFGATIEPDSISTSNASADATKNPLVTTLNKAIRGVIQGYSGYFEISDVVSTDRDSGIWKTGYSTDNIHPNQVGYRAIKNSGAINPSLFYNK